MFKRLPIAFAALVLSAAPAFAHAVPRAMTPGPDSTVSAPTEISMTFSEELEPKFSSIKLADSRGVTVSKVAAVLDPKNARHLTLAVPRGLAAGVYTVQWTSSAADGHRLSRTYNFTIK